MNYVSTRGNAPSANFERVLIDGLAPDGGLYMPETWPAISADDQHALQGASYADWAAAIMAPFTQGAFSPARLKEMAGRVYARFDHPAVAPLTRIGDEDWILELFHGPTLAFKDFAMQILGVMFDEMLARCGERLTIIAATSGDTGAAAIDALKHCQYVDVVVLHPEGRVTEIQRRMMTTVAAPNVHNIAVDGSFDDCQAIVKALFADKRFSQDVSLSGVNSINWARLAVQTVYYFSAVSAVSDGGKVNVAVPTGNFGDIFAGYAAKKMGLGIDRLAVAANANDIVHRALTSGKYARTKVTPTISPSMDIQVASNFERLLFEVMDRDADALAARMTGFNATGAITLSGKERTAIAADFVSHAASEARTLAEMKRHYDETGALIDPHTSVALCAARALRANGALKGKIVTLSTAHPAKFPDAVKRATGITPALPPVHEGLLNAPEEMLCAAASTEIIKSLILNRVQRKAEI